MRLNKDGTATLLVKGAEVSLPVPTWGQVKGRKEAFEKMIESLALIFTTVLDTMTEDEKRIYDRILQEKSRRTAASTKEGLTADEEYNLLPEDGQERVLSLFKAVQNQINTGKELAAHWWVDTVKLLTEVEVASDDLPSSLASTDSVSTYLNHVQTVPFQSGP